MTIQELKREFINLYGGGAEDIRVFRSPGRVNLIGEHIDYNGGKVLPAALSMSSTAAVRRTGGGKVRLKATDLETVVTLDLSQIGAYKALPWGNYQAGVIDELVKAGYGVTGCDILYHDTVPLGSGLSSSAAIEVVTALLFATFSNEDRGISAPVDGVEMALIGQRAENNYVGVSCGIMDQFASAMGKKDQAILLDCRTLEYTYTPLALGDCALVIGNTKKKRGLADSKYNKRRGECEEALRRIQTVRPEVENLCALTPEAFEALESAIGDATLLRRARHVVEENDRVSRSVKALQAGELETFGRYLNASHASLRDLYEVTGHELDSMVACMQREEGVLGARMTGAGFGGCTVALVRRDRVDSVIRAAAAGYEKATGLKPEFYISGAEDGCHEVLGEDA
ncbi:galactokinase [Oscillospiraceae bacterium OttesenSCG-928-F05]|nr:galactokinase [Oscillospiraceae bacterium OttesenSCG-928-F05]